MPFYDNSLNDEKKESTKIERTEKKIKKRGAKENFLGLFLPFYAFLKIYKNTGNKYERATYILCPGLAKASYLSKIKNRVEEKTLGRKKDARDEFMNRAKLVESGSPKSPFFFLLKKPSSLLAKVYSAKVKKAGCEKQESRAT